MTARPVHLAARTRVVAALALPPPPGTLAAVVDDLVAAGADVVRLDPLPAEAPPERPDLPALTGWVELVGRRAPVAAPVLDRAEALEALVAGASFLVTSDVDLAQRLASPGGEAAGAVVWVDLVADAGAADPVPDLLERAEALVRATGGPAGLWLCPRAPEAAAPDAGRAITAGLERFVALGVPVVADLTALGEDPDAGLATAVWALGAGVEILLTRDVHPVARAAKVVRGSVEAGDRAPARAPSPPPGRSGSVEPDRSAPTS